jgi:hypothetical protein
MAEISGVQHTRRRSTFVQLNLFTGSSGEIAADMTFMRLSLADGVTAGGWFSQKGNITRQSFPNSGIVRSAAGTDASEYVISQNAGTVLLPFAAAYPSGQVLTVVDSFGNALNATITINSATSTERIVGNTALSAAINSTTATINQNGVGVRLAALSTAGRWAIW